jgi:hypothetical protein
MIPRQILLFFHNDYADNDTKAGIDPERFGERSSSGLKGLLLRFELPKFLYGKLKGNATFVALLRTMGLAGGVPAKAATIATSTEASIATSTYERTFDLISRIDERANEGGAKLVVVVYPDERTYAHEGDWKNDEGNAKLLSFLKSAKIEYIDPGQGLYLAKRADGGCLTYFCEDHFNEKGHAAMAKILSEEIRASLPSSCSRPE